MSAQAAALAARSSSNPSPAATSGPPITLHFAYEGEVGTAASLPRANVRSVADLCTHFRNAFASHAQLAPLAQAATPHSVVFEERQRDATGGTSWVRFSPGDDLLQVMQGAASAGGGDGGAAGGAAGAGAAASVFNLRVLATSKADGDDEEGGDGMGEMGEGRNQSMKRSAPDDGSSLVSELLDGVDDDAQLLADMDDGDEEDASSAPAAASSSSVSPNKRARTDEGYVVRVRGLPWDCTENDIEIFFNGLQLASGDPIYLCRVGDKLTGEGYACFASAGHADLALQRNRSYIGSRYVEVYESSPSELADARQKYQTGFSFEPASPTSHVVLMKGVAYEASVEDVHHFFSPVPVLKVHIKFERKTARPSGLIFVEFATQQDAEQAMTKDRESIHGRWVGLSRSSHEHARSMFSDGPRDSFQPQDAGPIQGTQCVYMRGIPFSATESDITAFFSQARVVPQCIHRRPNGGDAYVQFHSPADQRAAMGLHRQYIQNRYIELSEISYAQLAQAVGLPPQQPGYAAPAAPPSYGGYGGYGAAPAAASSYGGYGGGYGAPAAGYGGGYAGGSSYGGGASYGGGYSAPAASHYGGRGGGGGRFDDDSSLVKVQLKGLPYSATERDIVRFFDNTPGFVESSVDFVQQGGRPSGLCFVRFTNEADAQAAVQRLDRQYIGDRYVQLKVYR